MTRALRFLRSCAVAPMAFAAACAGATEVVIQRHLEAMGTELRLVAAAADRATALQATEAAARAVAAVEREASTWRTDTPLARWNAAAVGGEPQLPTTLSAAITTAVFWAAATAGAFDPCIGTLVATYDLRGDGRWPEATELADARGCSGVEHLVRTSDGWSRRAPVQIEEGGFAKGWAVDAALAAARRAGATSATIDLGGQWGIDGRSVRLAVADPDRREQVLVLLEIDGGSVATSGNGVRGKSVGGQLLGHLLDPRTGLPAANFGSVTVWAGCGIDADCLATAMFVMGPEAAIRWADARDGIEVLTVARGPSGWELRATEALRAAVTWTASSARWVDVPVAGNRTSRVGGRPGHQSQP